MAELTLRDQLTDFAARTRSIVYSLTMGALESWIAQRMIGHDGRLRTTKYLPWRIRWSLASHYACRERAEIALMVANQYPGGDYFEFGSESFRTLMNFLSAFHLNGHDRRFPETKFFAFDLYGGADADPSLKPEQQAYFAFYRGLGSYHYRKAEARLRNHGVMVERSVPIQGYFHETLNDALKARLRAEGRRVGVAFLDCNIPSSYKTCFDFLADFIREDRAFIYMDEYFQTHEVPGLFDAFCASLRARYGLRARYIRNAGAYGALFILMREPQG
jgi:hypothetical protein